MSADLDWSACKSAQNSLSQRVEELQKTLPDGFRLDIQCSYSGNAKERKQSPVRHIPLTRNEITVLHLLRKDSHASYEALDSFEKRLLVAHRLPKLEPGDPCYRFIGFVLDDDFITDDPNPFMPWGCKR